MRSGLTRTFSSLSIYNYRIFWLGQLVSLSGTWMQTTAQAWLVLQLTDSPTALGTMTMLQFLPVTIFTLFGGVLADRSPKRLVLICTQTVAAAQALLLAALVLSGRVELWELYVLGFVLGLVNAFDTPTRQAFIIEMVGKEQIQNAVALNSSLFNMARIAGPALAGVLISTTGLGPAFLLNGLSFLPVIVGLLLMRRGELYPVQQSRRGNVFGQVAEGLRYSFRDREVLLILVLVGVLGTFGYNFITILPLIARYVFHSGAFGLGILTSAMGVGSLIAALGAASIRRTSMTVLVVAAALFSATLVAIGFSRSLPLTVILLIALGITSILFTAGANTRLQLQVPERLRGRVLSVYLLLFVGTTPIGSPTVGLLASRIGVQPMIVVMGVLCLLGVAAGVFATRGRAIRGHLARPLRRSRS